MTVAPFWSPPVIGILIAALIIDIGLGFLSHRLFAKYSHGFLLWLQVIILFLLLIVPLFQLVLWVGEFFWW